MKKVNKNSMNSMQFGPLLNPPS